ncbi:MAG: hypothetical protein GXY36_14225 [Chloroflexi bacterium]|nr:hypothetical protein [Chloroflexota bacterium]
MHEVPVEDVKDLDLDVILFQACQHYEADQYEILSDRQRRRPELQPVHTAVGCAVQYWDVHA